MSIKVGDRIRFLNEVGGGVVTKILPNNMVNVLDEDGFEIPVLISECVLIEATKPKLKDQNLEPIEEDDEYEAIEESNAESDELRLLLAFLPKPKSNNMFEVYLINDCNYYLYYTLLREDKDAHIPLSHGLIECNTKLLIGILSASEMQSWGRLMFQALPFKKHHFQLKSVVQYKVGFKSSNLFKSTQFSSNRYFESPVLLVDLILNELFDVSAQEVEMAMKEKQPEVKLKSKPHLKYPTVEVDLHINKLRDDCTGMSNLEILNFQMDKFHEIMKTNESFIGQEIVFIHGIGNGTLKAEIRRELKENYTKCEVEDASFKEYGFGATRIMIK